MVGGEALLVEAPQDADDLVKRLPGDEAGSAESHPVLADEPADGAVPRGGEDAPAQERVRRGSRAIAARGRRGRGRSRKVRPRGHLADSLSRRTS